MEQLQPLQQVYAVLSSVITANGNGIVCSARVGEVIKTLLGFEELTERDRMDMKDTTGETILGRYHGHIVTVSEELKKSDLSIYKHNNTEEDHHSLLKVATLTKKVIDGL